MPVAKADPGERGDAVHIRRVRGTDAAAVAQLYYDTVRRVNARDYSPRQIAAWAPRVYDEAYWRRRFRACKIFIAERAETVVGFAELEDSGHIDCFYVHHEHQGEGVGTRLMQAIFASVRRRRTRRLFAEVSITARPFFERMGFRVRRRMNKVYRNRSFRQYYMEKRCRA